jgi:uncharacterized protein (DUF1330 family)
MPKGYWIVGVTVRDQDRYPQYLAAAQAAFVKYGAKFLVRGGDYETMEGRSRERNVVVEFTDRAAALACYHSPEYKAARSLRQKYAETDFTIVEGAADTREARPASESAEGVPPNPQSTPPRSILRRIFDAMMLARERRAEVHLARVLRSSGGRLTDDIERRLMEETMRIGNSWF